MFTRAMLCLPQSTSCHNTKHGHAVTHGSMEAVATAMCCGAIHDPHMLGAGSLTQQHDVLLLLNNHVQP
jgi:hypothetical protein